MTEYASFSELARARCSRCNGCGYSMTIDYSEWVAPGVLDEAGNIHECPECGGTGIARELAS